MYYKLVSVLLLAAAVAARPAAALELACNTTTKLGTEALKYSRITHGPVGWTIVHTLKNGERRDRAHQYRVADLSVWTSLGWSGPQYDNPALVMRGELRPTTAGYYVYTEDLRDAKRYDLIIAQTQALCWELSALKPAPTPPRAESHPVSPELAEEEKPKDAPPAHDLTPAPEGELPADVTPHPENDTAKAAAPAAPAPPAKAPVGAPLPTIEYPQFGYPQYKFAREFEHSPVTGGSAESRYLTTVYRMIKAHLHESPNLRLDLANRHGIVDFYLDKGGTLVGRRLVSSSGSPNLDLAAMAAIAAAAPYPAPPNGHRSFNYNFGKSAQ